MVSHGVKKGDCVVIYMPMIPQTMYTMLACARIGAVHSLIFGGFASKELSSRIDHAKVINMSHVLRENGSLMINILNTNFSFSQLNCARRSELIPFVLLFITPQITNTDRYFIIQP